MQFKIDFFKRYMCTLHFSNPGYLIINKMQFLTEINTPNINRLVWWNLVLSSVSVRILCAGITTNVQLSPC